MDKALKQLDKKYNKHTVMNFVNILRKFSQNLYITAGIIAALKTVMA